MGNFFDDSQVSSVGDGIWEAQIAEGWDILGNTNGGYAMAMLARAISGATERPHPISMTGHYLAPLSAGPVEIRTQVLKSGRTIATATATMYAGDKPMVTALGSFGEHDQSSEVLLTDSAPPTLPDLAECIKMERPAGLDSTQPLPPPFMDKIDLRLHPDDVGFAVGKPSGTPQFRGWFRLRGDEVIDSFALVLAADSLPPTSFNSGLPLAWTPTVELTVHVRAVPSPGWLRLDFGTRFISNGRLEVDGLIWDSSDRLVAQSRQLALIPKEH